MSRQIAGRLAHSERYSLIRSFFTTPRPSPPLIHSVLPRPSIRFALFTQPPSTLHPTFYSSLCPVHYRPFSSRTTPPSIEPQQRPQHSTPTSHQDSSNHNRTPDDLYDNYPRFFRRLALSLPHVSRPSRDDFLNAANGFVQRMRVRVRWFFIRNFRKFNADDISAFVTWFLVGHGLWILIGTLVLRIGCVAP